MMTLTNKLFLSSKIGNLVSYSNNGFCNLPLTRSKPFLLRNTLKLFPNSFLISLFLKNPFYSFLINKHVAGLLLFRIKLPTTKVSFSNLSFILSINLTQMA